MTTSSAAGPTFSAAEWQLLLRFRCGAPCFQQASKCSGCGSRMDSLGYHSLSCPHNGMHRRHNHVRDALFHLCASAHWGPALEVALPNSTSRPADLLLRSLSVKPVAIDVTVSHPLRPSAPSAVRAATTSAAALAEQHKNSVSKGLCAAVGWDFLPFGFDSVRGLRPPARGLCQKLAKHLAMQAGASAANTALTVGQQLSLALAKGRGEMLSAATPIRPSP